jgi:pimeloyl-ACP methyl ester carboxylesterase
VLYNHGGFGTAVGGDLEATSRALAKLGYIGYAKARATTSASIPDSFDDVMDGVSELLAVPKLDQTQMAILGYSRGGLLSLRVAELYPDLFDAVVLMAPAPGAVFGDGSTTMDDYLEDVSMLGPTTQFLLLVAANDKPPWQMDADHVEIVGEVETALSAVGIEVSKIVYPAYSDDGHDIFQSVSEGGQGLLLVEGYYWNDVTNHFNRWIPNIWNVPTPIPSTSGWGLAALAVALLVMMAILLRRTSGHRFSARVST